MDSWILWAGEQGTPIVEDDVDVAFADADGEIKEFNLALHAQLVSSTKGHPSSLVRTCQEWNGLEASRVVMRRY